MEEKADIQTTQLTVAALTVMLGDLNPKEVIAVRLDAPEGEAARILRLTLLSVVMENERPVGARELWHWTQTPPPQEPS